MEPRGWWTVGLTALAGPVGAVIAAVFLGRLFGSGDGGMMGLAAAVSGLVLGGPMAAIAVFGICLLTLLRTLELKRAITFAIMIAAALLDGLIIVAGLRVVAGSSFAETGLLAMGMLSMAILGGGAHVAITSGDR